jgi:HlyD family secretion protein
MSWRKRLAGLLVCAGVLALIMWVLLPTPVPVELVAVTHRPFEQTIIEDGKTRVRQRYVISAPLAGTLERVTLKVGDQVEKGAVLAVIIPSTPALLDVRTERELQERLGAAEAGRARTLALVARARVALEQAQVDAERTRKLAQQKLVGLAQVEQEQLRVTLAAREFEAATCEDHAAAHQVELARAAFMRVRGEGQGGATPGHRWEIRSPVCGRVLQVVQESAGAVSTGTPLLEVADPSDLEVVIDVLTSDALKITAGAVARIDTGGGPILQGQVRLIEPGGFTKISALGVEEQRVNVGLDLVSPREQWSTLGDGYRVEAQIVTMSESEAVKVPVSALFRDGETWWVYVTANGRATKRAVQVGARNALEAVVAQGLDVGERLIVYPSDAVQEGIRVRAR